METTTESKRCLTCQGPCGAEPKSAAAWSRWQAAVCSELCWTHQRCLQCGEALSPEPLSDVPPGDPALLRARGMCSKRCFEIAHWHDLVAATRAGLEEGHRAGEVPEVTPSLVLRLARVQFNLQMPWTPTWEPPKVPRPVGAGTP